MKLHSYITCCAACLTASASAATLVLDQGKVDSSLISVSIQTITVPPAGAAGTYISTGSNGSGATMGRDSSIALGISNIAQSANLSDKQGMAFFNVGGTNYTNLFGFAYNYTGTTLTLYAGGFNEGWQSFAINGFSSTSTLTFFFDFKTAMGATKGFFYSVDGGEVQNTGMTFSSSFRFGNCYVSQVMLGNRDASGNGTWASNNANGGPINAIVQGNFTLDFLKGYDQNLALQEKQDLAATMAVIPEPSSMAMALFGLSGLMLRRRRRQA